MSAKIQVTPQGNLRLRIYWRNKTEYVGTRLPFDGELGRNYKRVAAWADVISGKLKLGTELHVALKETIGKCPRRLLPVQDRPSSGVTVKQVCEEYLTRLKQWHARGDARRSLLDKATIYIERVIVPYWKETPLEEVTHARLVAFQDHVLARTKRAGTPIKSKTAKNIVSGHFLAIIKRARSVHGMPVRNPFEGLEWPKKRMRLEPDPFTGEERDRILAYFREHSSRWYPWLNTLFWTGMRQSESTPRKRSDYDRSAGTLRISSSYSEGEEHETKTAGSVRAIQLLPEAIAGLETLPESLQNDPDDLLFKNREGTFINSKEWPKQNFYPVLRKLGIRVRKFYCTRHTFMTELISRGWPLKAIADYCGTSVTMIERSYGRWLPKGAPEGVVAIPANDPSRVQQVATDRFRSWLQAHGLRDESRTFPVLDNSANMARIVNMAKIQHNQGMVPRGIERPDGAAKK